MGNKNNRKKRQPAANRLGCRKGSQNHSESPGPPSSPLAARPSPPRPRPIYRGAPQSAGSPSQSQAAAALMALRHRAPMAASVRPLSPMERVFRGALNIPLSPSGDYHPSPDQFQEGKRVDANELDDIFTRPSQQDQGHFREEINGHDPRSGFSSRNSDEDENEEKDELESDSTVSEEDGDLCFKAPAFDIPFEVPYKNVTRKLSGITSHTSFEGFLHKVADRMGCGLTHLSCIGYVESYRPKNPKPVPRMLEERDDFLQLKVGVQDYRDMCLTKNKGKGKVKPFTIAIIDTSHGSAKEGKKKAGKDDGGDKTDDGQAQKTALSSPEVEAMKSVETANHCEQHKGPCLVLDDGSHYHLTMEDISTWAYVAVKNKLEVKRGEPPDDLKLHDKIGHKLSRQQSAKKAQELDRQDGSGGSIAMGSDPTMMNAWLPTIVTPATPPLSAVNKYASGRMMGSSTPHRSRTTTHPLSSSPLVAPSSGKRYSSSQLADCPELDVWLPSLDMHPRHGKFNINYQQFIPIFHAHGVYDVGDITDLSSERIIGIGGPNMTLGTANRLVKLAKEEIEKLVRAKKSRKDASKN
ncbi:hypothetical protein IW262DRAFT_1519311 [Armillaria fumosa]|nr:hypothetical protein IW262DRAFT_1519311 [Armillaria fumosa]